MRIARALSKRWVPNRGVDLKKKRLEVVVETAQSPGRLSDRVVALGDLSDVARDLSVTAQVVNELGVRDAVMWPSQLLRR